MAPTTMPKIPLSLHFEGSSKKLVYHQVGLKGVKSSTLDLDSIIGNDNGEYRWGWGGYSLSAKNQVLDGAKLKAKLYTKTGAEVECEINLADHIHLVGDKLERFDLPIIPQQELDRLNKERAELLVKIAAIEKNTEKMKKDTDEANARAEATQKAKEEIEKRHREEREAHGLVDEKLKREAAERDAAAKLREKKLEAENAETQARHRQEEKFLEEKFKRAQEEAELVVGSSVAKAEMNEALELRTAHDRLQISEQLKLAQKKLAEEAELISTREINLSKTYGDHAWLNSEIKERDLKMSLMFSEKADLYRELSFSHERFSTLDTQRISMSEEQHRIRASYASLMDGYEKTSAKLSRVTIECQRQRAELTHTLEEKKRFESKSVTLEAELEELRKENHALKTQTASLKEERTIARTKFEAAQTTITTQESVIKHFDMWKVLYEQQIQSLRKELSEVTVVMSRLEQSYQDTARAFRVAVTEKEKLQSELTEVSYSKTAVEARVLVVEQALQVTRTELSHLSKSYEEKDDELRAIASHKAILERRLSELTITHSRERNVTRNISERLVHVQGNMAENVDWMYDMRHDLTEESKYLHLHYLHNGGSIGLGLQSPPTARLPSYGSAVNSPAGSPAREALDPLKDTLPTEKPIWKGKTENIALAAGAAAVAPPIGVLLGAAAIAAGAVAPPAASIEV